MKIAIVKLSALGDIIHAMVALQFIKKHIPNVQIDWVVEKGFKSILESNPDINKIHTIELKKAKSKKSIFLLIRELLKLRKLPKYDIVIDAQGLIKSAIVAKLIPSKTTFGFDKNSLREGFAANFYSDTCAIDYAENIIKRNAFLISQALNINISSDDIINKQPFLFSNALTSKLSNYLVIIPGASFASKIYPHSKFADLCNSLKIKSIVVWGNDEEKRIADKIKKLTSYAAVSEKLSIDELKLLISNASLVIGGDTGPTHMAWALNVPSVTIFGSTPGYRNTITTDVNKVIESSSNVNPNKIDKSDYSIKDIKVGDIAKIANKLLKDKY